MTRRILLAVGCVALAAGCTGGPGEREFRKGVREVERGNHVRGKALLEKSVNLRPAHAENAVALGYIGLACWMLGQPRPAVEAFEESRRLDPELPGVAYNLAVAAMEAGDTARAVGLLEEAARVDPEDARPLELLGRLHARDARWPEARRALFGALARAPQAPRVLTALAAVEYSISGVDKAVFYLMQALEKKRDYPPALYNLSLLYRRDVGDAEQAAAYLRKYLEAAPRTDPHVGQARAILAEMEPRLAVPTAPAPIPPVPPVPSPAPIVTAAIEPSPPRAPPAPPARAAEDAPARLLQQARSEAEKGRTAAAVELYLGAAAAAERAGDKALQEKALRTAVQLGFDQPRAHAALGQFLAAQGKHEAAVPSYRQALLLDPKSASAHLELARAAAGAGELDTALVEFKQATQLDPANPDAFWLLARLYDEQMELPDRAARVYLEFEQRFPADPRVSKARERLKAIRPPSAAPAVPPAAAPRAEPAPTPALPAVVAAPPAPPVSSAPPARRLQIRSTVVRNTHAAVQAYNRGTFYQQKEDWERAIYFYTRAVENDDTFATAFFNLGTVYWARGDRDLAKDAYLRALELRPDMTAARYNMALVHREMKERAGVIEQLKALLQTQPDYAPAHYVLGYVYAEKPSDHALAKQHYRRFLELSPGDPTAQAVRDWIATH